MLMSDESSVERLRKLLYRRSGGPAPRKRRALHDKAYEVNQGWVHDEDAIDPNAEPDPEAMLESLRRGEVPGAAPAVPTALKEPLLRRAREAEVANRQIMGRLIRSLFAASAVFFIVSLGVAGYFILNDKNRVSCDNLEVNISGPLSVAAGRELALQVGIVNKNPVAMLLTDLIVDFPDGARSPSDLAIPLPSVREQIGTIDAGERVRSTVRSVLFGEENEQQEIKTTIEYRVEESNALFVCEVPYKVLISASPVAVTVDGLREVSSGQALELTVVVTNNSDAVLSNLLLVGSFPFGFRPTTAQPTPTYDDRVWNLGDLAPGTARTIVVRGTMTGENSEERVFRFEIGSQSTTNPKDIVRAFETADHVVMIARPFIALDLSVDGQTGSDVTITPGANVNANLAWVNQLPYPLHDVEIEAKITGPLLRPESVRASNGFYRSMDNTIIWTPQTENRLTRIDPGDRGNFSFSFATQRLSSDTGARDPQISIEFRAKGRRLSEHSNVPEVIEAQARRTLRLATDLQFNPRLVWSVGPFTNVGSHPPRAETETTYTVIWQIANTTNDLVDVVTTARLPVYVEWENTLDPANESMVYNPVTRQLTWRVGDVPAGSGFDRPAREVAFQVAITPSVSQVGIEPVIVENQLTRGVDRFTGGVIEVRKQDLTTRITTDPNITWAPGRVLP